jgi:DHA3 family macrolide efflux protein-like MFS transporter
LTFMPIFNLAPNNMVSLTSYAMVIAALQALFELTITAIIPDVLRDEDICKANSALQSIYALIGIFGVIIGSIAYTKLNMNMIFLIDALSFVLSGIFALFLKPVKDQKDHHHELPVNYFNIIKETFSYLKSKADIRFFLIFTMVVTFVFASMVILVLPYIGYKLIKVSAFQLSLLQAAWSVGTITGAVFVSTRKAPQNLINKYFFFLLIQSILLFLWVFPLGINTAAFNKWPVCIGYFILVLLLGVFNSIQTIPIITYFQNSVPEQMRARFFGVFHTAILVACPLGMFVYGALLAKVFWAYLPLVSGGCMLVVSVLSQKSKTFIMYVNGTEKEEEISAPV